MIKALLISFLVHSLAFAGTLLLLGSNFSSKTEEGPKTGLISVGIVSTFTEKGQVKKKAALETTRTRPSRALSSAATVNSGAQMTDGLESDGGAANLIPYPTNQPPTYPEGARERGLSGKMTLELVVDKTGFVIEAKVTEGRETCEILQESALRAVCQWRFYYKNSGQGKVTLSLPIVFDLET